MVEQLVAIGEKMALTGADLCQSVTDQQRIEREETQKGTRTEERRTRSHRKGRRNREGQKQKTKETEGQKEKAEEAKKARKKG